MLKWQILQLFKPNLAKIWFDFFTFSFFSWPGCIKRSLLMNRINCEFVAALNPDWLIYLRCYLKSDKCILSTVTTSLFNEFKENLCKCESMLDVFSMVDAMEESCTEHVQLLSKVAVSHLTNRQVFLGFVVSESLCCYK